MDISFIDNVGNISVFNLLAYRVLHTYIYEPIINYQCKVIIIFKTVQYVEHIKHNLISFLNSVSNTERPLFRISNECKSNRLQQLILIAENIW